MTGISGRPSRRAVLFGTVGMLGAGAAQATSSDSGQLLVSGQATAAPIAAAPVVELARRESVRFGINYTPSRHWWFVWQQWDPARVDNDLAQIAALGVDHIRIQLMWNVFQPTPGTVRPDMLHRLATMLDLAGRHGLDACVSLLTGYLSGMRFLPVWARGNIITQPATVKGELTLFREVGKAVGHHPHLLGFDIGNEVIGRFTGTPVSQQQSWCDGLIAASRAAAPGKLHSVSGISKFLAGFPTIMSTAGDVSVVHPWFFYRGAVNRGKLTPQAVHHVELNVEYIKSFHTFDPTRSPRLVWVQEVGAPDSTIPTALHPDFVSATMRNALSCDDLYGITWWDSHDIDTHVLPKFSTPESSLGLFDVRGRLKPAGKTFAAEIARWKRGPHPVAQQRRIAVSNIGPDLWQQLAAGGTRPAMVPLERVTDQAYLAQRGITQVVGTQGL